jgi:hypothetical protein
MIQIYEKVLQGVNAKHFTFGIDDGIRTGRTLLAVEIAFGNAGYPLTQQGRSDVYFAYPGGNQIGVMRGAHPAGGVKRWQGRLPCLDSCPLNVDVLTRDTPATIAFRFAIGDQDAASGFEPLSFDQGTIRIIDVAGAPGATRISLAPDAASGLCWRVLSANGKHNDTTPRTCQWFINDGLADGEIDYSGAVTSGAAVAIYHYYGISGGFRGPVVLKRGVTAVFSVASLDGAKVATINAVVEEFADG